MLQKIKLLLSLSLVGLIGLNSANAVAENDKKVYKIKLATSWNPAAEVFSNSVIRFAQRVEKLSNGEIQIEIHDATKTKAPFGVLDFVKSGQYQMGNTPSYYYKGKDPNLMPFTAMPFGMDTVEQLSWFYHGGGLELMQKAFAPHNIYSFPGGNSGMQMSGWFKKEIKTVEDLQGLKMRIPGFAGEVMSRVGVTVTNIAAGEIYTALERNVIDAVEWIGPALDLKIGFPKIMDYYYSGWSEPTGEISYFVNKKFFDSLPENLQFVLTESMRLASYDMMLDNINANSIALAKIRKDYPNVKILDFPTPVLDSFKQANNELKAEYAAKYPLLKEIFASQDDYLKLARDWTQLSQYNYLRDNYVEYK